ncbi:MAG: hypothetical protein ISN28_11005, partial [Ectothiorhodospiraceae bacterium AqS1]|nr:hypothetical protein [Ectothiorhodospiraceae bacterium AqS1]
HLQGLERWLGRKPERDSQDASIPLFGGDLRGFGVSTSGHLSITGGSAASCEDFGLAIMNTPAMANSANPSKSVRPAADNLRFCPAAMRGRMAAVKGSPRPTDVLNEGSNAILSASPSAISMLLRASYPAAIFEASGYRPRSVGRSRADWPLRTRIAGSRS